MAESRETSMQDLYLQLYDLCESKAEEFALLGYDHITAEDVWKCVSSAYRQLPPLHQIVNDILSLKVNKYMNWLMVNMYKDPGSI